MEIGSSKQMENLRDSDHINNSIKSSIPLYPTVNGIYKGIEKNNTNGWIEKPVTAKVSTLKDARITNGITTSPIHADITVNEQMLSTVKPPMGFGFSLREEHCKAVADPKEEHLKKKLDEVTNGHHLNVNNNTEKLQENEMVYGMVSFVGD